MNADDIVALYRSRGHIAYEGEGVTQLQHGWQCARLARRAEAADALVLAAWLHDLGHLMTEFQGSPTLAGIDDGHEHLGATALEAAFGHAVSRPVMLHVQAKRYLVGMQPGYRSRLSPDALRSLMLQGGPMNAFQAAQFGVLPHAHDALRLRAWDDQAKQPDLHPPGDPQALDELRVLMARVVQREHA